MTVMWNGDRQVEETGSGALDEATIRGVLAHWPDVADAPITVRRSAPDLTVSVGDRRVLTVTHPSTTLPEVDMEMAALAHLRAVAPDLPLPDVISAADGRMTVASNGEAGKPRYAVLTSALPGAPLGSRPLPASTAEEVGALTARMQTGLHGFFHPAAGRYTAGDIRSLPGMVPAGGSLADIVARVQPALDATRALPSWVQHGGVTPSTVLTNGAEVTGVVGFGGMHHTAAVCDLAGVIASVLADPGTRRTADTWDLMAAIVDGYQRHRLLHPGEARLLGELVIAGLALASVAPRLRHSRGGDGRGDGADHRALDELAALRPRELAGRVERLVGTSYVTAGAPAGGIADGDGDLLTRRRAVMAGGLSPLFYETPLHIVRGQGPWVFTNDGMRLLDAYNNVAVVGHSHPAVTQPVSHQIRLLNTHSRYLHEGVVRLAERILATMPDGLDTCLFTTSGTEANELAWRLATAYTGGTGALVAEHAYHGSTKWMADLSPNEWPPGHRPRHVATFVAPHGLRDGCGESIAAERIAASAAQLRAAGDLPALVLADSMFTSEGVLDTPADFLRGLRTGAHSVGALYLADEVQAGYGRSGPLLWRFALSGVVPDMVSLGKPMGAGYPLGALVTRRDIAATLARDYEYFSTFAATPVAAAAGLAVLDVLQDQGIPARAAAVGERLRSRLRALAGAHPAVGEVRGVGLVAGIDLRPPEGESARTFARGVLNALVQHRVMAGLTGASGTVLKVRPPLIWRDEHADLFVETLDRVLTEVARRG